MFMRDIYYICCRGISSLSGSTGLHFLMTLALSCCITRQAGRAPARVLRPSFSDYHTDLWTAHEDQTRSRTRARPACRTPTLVHSSTAQHGMKGQGASTAHHEYCLGWDCGKKPQDMDMLTCLLRWHQAGPQMSMSLLSQPELLEYVTATMQDFLQRMSEG